MCFALSQKTLLHAIQVTLLLLQYIQYPNHQVIDVAK